MGYTSRRKIQILHFQKFLELQSNLPELSFVLIEWKKGKFGRLIGSKRMSLDDDLKNFNSENLKED